MAVAAVATATLIDLDLIDNQNMAMTIDRSNIRREAEKLRDSMKREYSEEINNKTIEGIYFDGRKD